MTQHKQAMPLASVMPGDRVRLVKVKAGRCLALRLAELGLTPGVELELLQNQGGPLLISVRDSRLALGQGMAHKVLVETIDEESNYHGN